MMRVIPGNVTRAMKSGASCRRGGGLQSCGKPVFADRTDPDYRRILQLCRKGKVHLESITRFDMPGFRPSPMYLREMQRYGIAAGKTAADAGIDVYRRDQAYWESLWWRGLVSQRRDAQRTAQAGTQPGGPR